ncbi:MAG TPA: glutamyl-tRNA reductase, partial [Deltaproteobacteria bacterium]|nr:glutamyl-tRNA reductase [Deltaproteobacteria bacterium]
MDRIRCLSINHKNAPVAIRERIRIAPQDVITIMGRDSEAYVLNTCNRTEVYWTAIDTEAVLGLLERISGVERASIERVSEYLTGGAAVRHLFMVASGLDS